MKYLNNYKIFENTQDIDAICEKYGIRNYTINEDGSIDVNGNVDILNKGLIKLPLNFRNVSGYFMCSNNKLTSLDGAPKSVNGYFFAHTNELRDIYNISKVLNDIYIMNNPVDSLVKYFIEREDKDEWIELFNELDIIQDGYNVILDRLKYFYEGTKLNINITDKMLEKIKKQGYKII